jgi:hypothetical protein
VRYAIFKFNCLHIAPVLIDFALECGDLTLQCARFV